MRPRIQEHHHGNEIRVDRCYFDGRPGATAVVRRLGADLLRVQVREETGAEVDVDRVDPRLPIIARPGEADTVAFEVAWQWSCLNRQVSLDLGNDLVSWWVTYTSPDGPSARVYTANSEEEAATARRLFVAILTAQWRAELDEHRRRRDGLPGLLTVLRSDIASVEEELRPLKGRLKNLREEAEAAPRRVYVVELPDNTVADLAADMARRLAEDGPRLQDLLDGPVQDAHGPEADVEPEVPAKGKAKPPKKGERRRGGKGGAK